MKPMLAVNIKVEDVRFPVFASAKLDGVRGVVVDGQLRSRSLKPIPNQHVTRLLSRQEIDGYDGELITKALTLGIQTRGLKREELVRAIQGKTQ